MTEIDIFWQRLADLEAAYGDNSDDVANHIDNNRHYFDSARTLDSEDGSHRQMQQVIYDLEAVSGLQNSQTNDQLRELETKFELFEDDTNEAIGEIDQNAQTMRDQIRDLEMTVEDLQYNSEEQERTIDRLQDQIDNLETRT